jgi:hypothetical protein
MVLSLSKDDRLTMNTLSLPKIHAHHSQPTAFRFQVESSIDAVRNN